MGDGANAVGNRSVAIGNGAESGSDALQVDTIAIGTNAQARYSGNDVGSTAVGSGANAVSGIAIGNESVAVTKVGPDGVYFGCCIGDYAQATDHQSAALR